jgi:glycosyltransferase involved in cell wall biosynthesis
MVEDMAAPPAYGARQEAYSESPQGIDLMGSNLDRLPECLGTSSQPSPPRYRIAAIFPRPHPYFCKFLQRLSIQPEIDLTVYFYSDVGVGAARDPTYGHPLQFDTDLLAGYRFHFLRNYAFRPRLYNFWGAFHPGLLRELNRRYDAVMIHGWCGLSTWMAFALAWIRRVPILLHSDQNVIQVRGSLRLFFRNILYRALFERVAAFLVVGRRNAAFYRNLGVPEAKMFLTPLAVDNAFFREERRRLAPERAALRRTLGIPLEATVILSMGRLVPEKGLLDLLSAFGRLPAGSAHLVLVGDGPQRATLEDYVHSRDLKGVHFAGFKNYSQLPSFYALADVFVLPSYREPWGAVVNEAMNFALPIVASQDGGAVADLVEEGRNGLLFQPGDQEQLARHLGYLISHPEVREQMGAESVRRIALWDFERDMEGVLAALSAVGGHAQGVASR